MIRFQTKKSNIPMYDELKDFGLDEIDSLSEQELHSIHHYNIYYKALKKKLEVLKTGCAQRAYLSQIKYQLNDADAHGWESHVNLFQNVSAILLALFVSKLEQVFNKIVPAGYSALILGLLFGLVIVGIFFKQNNIAKIEDNNNFYLHLISDIEKELKL